MDKLRPVLKQMFWICTGFVILLAVCGWWMAMGSLHEQIVADTGKLDTANTASKAGEATASAAWTEAAKKVNEEDRRKFEEAEADLHRRQSRYRTYPPKIAAELQAETFGSPIQSTALRGEYGKLYESQFLEQLKVLNPFIVQDNEGLIDVNVDEITKADPSSWPNLRPTSAEIWKAQEDLWLLRSLFESINAANEGADRLGKAPVRQLLSLQMRGGTEGGGPSAEASGGGGGRRGGKGRGRQEPAETWSWDSPGGKVKDKDVGDGSLEDDMSAPGGPNPGATFEGDLETDLLTEEYGPDPGGGRLRQNAAGIGGGGMMGGGGGMMGGGSKGLGSNVNLSQHFARLRGGGSSFGGAQQQAGPSIEKQLAVRYVHDHAEYRTRAFQLHVRVHHAHLPVLLAELTNSSFPVEIVRVNAQFWGQDGGGGRGGRPRGRARVDEDDDVGPFSGRNRGRGGPSRFFGRNRRPGAGGGALTGGLLDRLASGKYDPIVAEQGESQRRTALSDPALAEVKIAGLMTIYRSREENEAVEQTEREDLGAQAAAAAAAADAAAADAAGAADAAPAEDAEAEQSGELLLDAPANAAEEAPAASENEGEGESGDEEPAGEGAVEGAPEAAGDGPAADDVSAAEPVP